MNTDPEVLSAQAKAIVDRAKALGLIWTMRPATVGSIVGTAAMVRYDGDTELIGAVSLYSGAFSGDRVMMIQVPPAGNFIIGRELPPLVKQFTVARGQEVSAGDVTLTTSVQALTGLVSFTATAPAVYMITATFDLDHTVSGGNNMGIGSLQVDTVAVGGTSQFGVTAAGQRASVGCVWYGSLDPGAHTFRIFGVKTVNVGTFIARATHTKFTYEVWQ